MCNESFYIGFCCLAAQLCEFDARGWHIVSSSGWCAADQFCLLEFWEYSWVPLSFDVYLLFFQNGEGTAHLIRFGLGESWGFRFSLLRLSNSTTNFFSFSFAFDCFFRVGFSNPSSRALIFSFCSLQGGAGTVRSVCPFCLPCYTWSTESQV
ncbi:unnamed protein product [Linum tenue]|uniref:Uncharacterized protein n=1 Tax=Linum tenue TaxID=586396 RepID=A0AAV0H2C1_9ROSI|nr:unnamed protein product [Linum tenue]